MTKVLDLTGATFGRLTVVARAENDRHGKAYWLCKCSCGAETAVYSGSLRKGRTQSCGCWHREDLVRRAVIHGDAGGPEYLSWANMIKRCSNPNHIGWKHYGGRGITVCDRWRNSYENFLADMGRRPSKTHSIDRINVDGNYEPGNCRWATKREQCLNTRKQKDQQIQLKANIEREKARLNDLVSKSH